MAWTTVGKIGVDLFDLEGVPYLVVMDYYSRYPELKQLTRTRSLDVILVMQGVFARHGIPNMAISDNGPQFSSEEFKEFSRDTNLVIKHPHQDTLKQMDSWRAQLE